MKFLGDILRLKLRLILVALALETCGHRLPSHMNEEVERARETLQIASLAMFPNLTLGSDKLLSHNALGPLILSNTWCMLERCAKLSLRWCSLARFIINNHEESSAISQFMLAS